MRIALAAAALVLAACSSQSTVQTHAVTDAAVSDAHRRAEVHTALAGEYFSRGNFTVALNATRGHHPPRADRRPLQPRDHHLPARGLRGRGELPESLHAPVATRPRRPGDGREDRARPPRQGRGGQLPPAAATSLPGSARNPG